MTDALPSIVIAALSSVGTWYATSVSHRKLKSEEAQGLTSQLIAERTQRESDMRTLRTEFETVTRGLRAEIKQLQDERENIAERAHEMFELDRRIRHDSSTLIRNLLSRAYEAGMEWSDLIERSKELEVLRERRRGMTA